MFNFLPNLRRDWLKQLQRAWSVRLNLLAILLAGLEVALPYFEDFLPIPHGIFGALSGVVSMGALYAKICVQKNLPEVTRSGVPNG